MGLSPGTEALLDPRRVPSNNKQESVNTHLGLTNTTENAATRSTQHIMIRDHPRRFLLDFLVTALLLLLCIRNIALLNGRQEGEILEPSPSTSWSGSTTHNNSGHLTRSIKPHTVFRKRAGTSYWPKALQRGNDLKCLLAMPPENFPEAQKSQWLTYDQLAQYGWESDSIPGFSAGSVAPALDFFGLSKSVPPNARIDWDHNEATTIGGVMYPVAPPIVPEMPMLQALLTVSAVRRLMRNTTTCTMLRKARFTGSKGRVRSIGSQKTILQMRSRHLCR